MKRTKICLEINNPKCDLKHLLRTFRRWLRRKTLKKYHLRNIPNPNPPVNNVFHFYEFRDWLWYHTNRQKWKFSISIVDTITKMSVLGWEIIHALEAVKLITRVRHGTTVKNDFDFRFGDQSGKQKM